MEHELPKKQVGRLRGKVAAVNCSRRLALLTCILVLFIQGAQAQPGEPRSGSLDMILLIDKSLSMAPFYEEARTFVAGKVIGPILVPGDRLIVETVYGKTDRLISTDIGSEEDKAKAIRAIRSIKANGRFTDLGAALDKAKRDLDELGQPDRPKYVLLITDERQEAPRGSPYQAIDHKLKHPSLEYVKRVDLGKFRAITVGLQVGAKVAQNAPAVMQLLMDPPLRGESPASESQGNGKVVTTGGSTASERALPTWLLFGAVGLFVISLAILAIMLVLAKKRKKESLSELKAEQ